MDVFVYGTLTDPGCAQQILADDRFEYAGSAVLDGLHRIDGRYPTLVPGGRVRGRILRIGMDAIDALDAYEGVDRGLYLRTSVPIDERTIEVYIGDPDRLDVSEEWPGNGPFTTRVDRYLSTHDIHLKIDV